MKTQNMNDKEKMQEKLNTILVKGICNVLRDFNARTNYIVTNIQVCVNQQIIFDDIKRDVTLNVSVAVSTDVEEVDVKFDKTL